MNNNINLKRNEFGSQEGIKNLKNYEENILETSSKNLPEILFITSFPPRECGIATYSQDLIKALNSKFNNSFKIQICPLESDFERHVYVNPPKYFLNVDLPNSFVWLAESINLDSGLKMVVVQHEFGFLPKRKLSFFTS